MKIGIIGPNKIGDSSMAQRRRLLKRLAIIIAASQHDIVLTPDKGSLLEYFAEEYIRHNGHKVWLVIPTEEKDHADYLNTTLGEIISCNDWDRQANEYNRQSDIYVCAGYSWGAMKEIACAQYFNNKKVMVVKEFISEKLPEELNFLVSYVSIDELEHHLKS